MEIFQNVAQYLDYPDKQNLSGTSEETGRLLGNLRCPSGRIETFYSMRQLAEEDHLGRPIWVCWDCLEYKILDRKDLAYILARKVTSFEEVTGVFVPGKGWEIVACGDAKLCPKWAANKARTIYPCLRRL